MRASSKSGDYDNYKDAIVDAKGLVKEAAKLGNTDQKNANAHLSAVLKRVEREVHTDATVSTYLSKLYMVLKQFWQPMH
jgi:predicted regulator of Ras-like GTPase activity (Roadblock/LC7/MglB family)